MKHLAASGQLAIVGRIQEQHPQRRRLFMQWHQMDWPVVIDPLNLLERKVHWNNEVDDLLLCIEAPPGWEIERQLHRLENPPEPVSAETRRLDFEPKCAATAAPGEATLTAYALYHVCEDVDGTCLYRRQDIGIPLGISGDQIEAGD